ncbi:MAG: hypothetical protein IPM51_08975 [Sphingobacteriaceae bacterium]|nr:hypothetical protein [Sphingobacteriaceae bacterium]
MKSHKLLIAVLVLFSITTIAQEEPVKSGIDSTHIHDLQNDSNSTKFNIPIFSTSGGDVDADLEQQDVSSLLSSSRDVFLQFASFQFGASRYRTRGYMAENQQVMINGVNVNNVETGFSSWSNWGGLNDVTRYVETRFGNFSNRLGFSGAGGYINIESKASSFRKGTRVSYANSNRIYGHRVMLTHSTGMMQNGWAVTASASSRYGNQVYIPGTYFNASAFYLSVDKNINDKHLISFTGFGAPIEQGRSSAAQLEAYRLTGTNYYNDSWGYQNGKVRNASVKKVNRPMLMLSHINKISSTARMTTSLFYNFGKSGLTGLNFNDAQNPRATYYRYLPSFYYLTGDNATGDALTYKWENNIDGIQQINWDNLIALNKANLYSEPGVINTTETRARYILENREEKLKNAGFNVVYNEWMGNIFLSVGANGNIYRNRRYKTAEDLLGASFWLDVDQFAENLGVDPNVIQNDIDNPNRKIRQGEKYGYDYSTNINKGEIWAQGEYTMKNVDAYLGFSFTKSQIWREGFMANGKFPTTSKGKSDVMDFNNVGVKGGLTYKVSGRHFLTVNASFLTRAPEAANIFISPRVRNDLVKGITQEEVISSDFNYLIKYPNFKFRFTAYSTSINNQTWVRTYWHDSYNNNVNLIMTDVDQKHQGIEIGVEKTLFTAHRLQAAFGYGQFLYNSRPVLQAWQDNNATEIFKERTTYLKNYKIGGAPQMVTGVGYSYNGKKFWFAGINFNFIDEIYIEPNPDKRTAESGGKFQTNELEQADLVIGQEQLPSYYTVNLNAGKSFRISKKYYLRFNGSINNLLNNKNIITGGYEQLRWDTTILDQFPNKYYYMTGITYMVIVNFSF